MGALDVALQGGSFKSERSVEEIYGEFYGPNATY